MRCALILLACLFATTKPTIAQETANSLLWRITGNGLAKPSYLYGTMHMQARKLFNFPDSLYTAISNTDAFALEVNPDSMNNALSELVEAEIAKNRAEKTGKKEKQLKDILTKAELKTLRENMPENSGINPEELTVKQVYLMKDKLVKHKPRKDDMPTFMDAFLYTIARDQGKVISGLEHMEDQVKLLGNTDMGDVDPKKVMEVFNQNESIEDQMIALYVKKDMVALQKMSEMFPEKTEKALLSNRNKIMLRSMDSIMAKYSLFTAVGTLHLPGKMGLISLLREKGYTVEPVTCNTYTNGANYKFKVTEKAWVTMVSEKDGYSIKMPGTPTDIDAYSGTIKMKMYFDLATSKCFATSHIPHSENPAASTADLLDEMASKMVNNAAKLETHAIENSGLTGKEYYFTDKDGNNYRLQLLGSNTDVYLLMAYSKSKDTHSSDPFFESFKTIPKSKSSLKPHFFEDALITVAVPENKPSKSVTYTKDSTQQQIMYTIVDPTIGCYYFVVCNQANAKYNFNNDTLWASGLKESLDGNGMSLTRKKGHLGKYNTEEFITSEFTGHKVAGKLVFCGNRVYKVMTQYPSNEKGQADADSFLASIRIQAAVPEETHYETAHEGAFATDVPEPFVEIKTAAEGDGTKPKQYEYTSWDKTARLTYYITAKELSGYYWKSDDSLMLKNWLLRSLVTSDTAPEYKYYRENGLLCGEARAIKKYTSQVHRIKVVSAGRHRYALDCTYPTYLQYDRNVAAFYDSFKVLKKDAEQLQPSPAKFIAALHSNDSTTFKHASKSLSEVFFSRNDVPLLLKEIASPFRDDSGNYHIVGSHLFNQLKEYPGELSVADLEQLYKNESVSRRGQQQQVLMLLIKLNDSIGAYKKLKELLVSTPPQKGSSYNLGYELRAHLSLAQTLYPELLQLAADSITGSMACDLARALMDSGYLKKEKLEAMLPSLIEKSRQARQYNSPYQARGIMQLLATFKSPLAWDEIKQYQGVNSNYLKYLTVKLLCDNGINPLAVAVDSLAADKYYRLDTYHLLEGKGSAGLFPAQYRTQQYFAESYLANYDEDGAYNSYKPLGVKRATYNGEKQKFYLFELGQYDDSSQHTLGIAGPFSDDNKVTTIGDNDNATGVYSETINTGDLENQLKLYLIKRKIDDMPPQKEIED